VFSQNNNHNFLTPSNILGCNNNLEYYSLFPNLGVWNVNCEVFTAYSWYWCDEIDSLRFNYHLCYDGRLWLGISTPHCSAGKLFPAPLSSWDVLSALLPLRFLSTIQDWNNPIIADHGEKNCGTELVDLIAWWRQTVSSRYIATKISNDYNGKETTIFEIIIATTTLIKQNIFIGILGWV